MAALVDFLQSIKQAIDIQDGMPYDA